MTGEDLQDFPGRIPWAERARYSSLGSMVKVNGIISPQRPPPRTRAYRWTKLVVKPKGCPDGHDCHPFRRSARLHIFNFSLTPE
jgi:hypothetical protein